MVHESHAVALTLELDVFADAVCHVTIQAFIDSHLLSNVLPGHLVQFVHCRRDCPDLVFWYTADGEETIEQLAVIDLR